MGEKDYEMNFGYNGDPFLSENKWHRVGNEKQRRDPVKRKAWLEKNRGKIRARDRERYDPVKRAKAHVERKRALDLFIETGIRASKRVVGVK